LKSGVNDRYVVAVTGRICRRTSYIPLSKAQSVRRVQGPVERLLGLSSILVDVAGSRVGADMLFRGTDDADELLSLLVRLTRAARLGAADARVAPGQTAGDFDQRPESTG